MRYIEYWILTFKQQFKNSTIEQKRELRRNIFKNVHLTTKEKEQVWELIVS